MYVTTYRKKKSGESNVFQHGVCVCLCVYMHVCVHTCMCMCIYACVCAYMHVYVCVCGGWCSEGLAEIVVHTALACTNGDQKNGIRYAHDPCFVIHASTT